MVLVEKATLSAKKDESYLCVHAHIYDKADGKAKKISILIKHDCMRNSN